MKFALIIICYVALSASAILYYNYTAWDVGKDKLDTRITKWALDNKIEIVYIDQCRGDEKNGHCRVFFDSSYKVYRTVECTPKFCFQHTD